MPRAKFQTLTEQMFYILLCLKDECYGIDIFEKIAQITDGNHLFFGHGIIAHIYQLRHSKSPLYTSTIACMTTGVYSSHALIYRPRKSCS